MNEVAQAVSEYMQLEVAPHTKKLFISEGYARKYLGESGMRRYMAGLTKMGHALQMLPQDFTLSAGRGRHEDVQVAVEDAARELQAVFSQMPDPRPYLAALEDIRRTTHPFEIGAALEPKFAQTGTRS